MFCWRNKVRQSRRLTKKKKMVKEWNGLKRGERSGERERERCILVVDTNVVGWFCEDLVENPFYLK